MKYIIIILVIGLLGGGYYYMNERSDDYTEASIQTSNSNTNLKPVSEEQLGTTNGTSKKSESLDENANGIKKAGFTMADVATHNSKSSCWGAINGNVYDLTLWIANHPGGEKAILSICGKDGSSAFDKKHGESEKALAQLSNFLIGPLVQ